MNALRILDEVKAAGGRLTFTAPDRLRVEAQQPLDADLLERVRAHKPEIIHALRESIIPSPFDREAFDERVAIIEANGIPRAWADVFAIICTMSCPASISSSRWLQIVNDGGLFLDQWRRQSAALNAVALQLPNDFVSKQNFQP